MFQKDLLKDRAIFITGGGSGLGRSMALRFSELGAHLFVVGRREEPAPARRALVGDGSALQRDLDVEDLLVRDHDGLRGQGVARVGRAEGREGEPGVLAVD